MNSLAIFNSREIVLLRPWTPMSKIQGKYSVRRVVLLVRPWTLGPAGQLRKAAAADSPHLMQCAPNTMVRMVGGRPTTTYWTFLCVTRHILLQPLDPMQFSLVSWAQHSMLKAIAQAHPPVQGWIFATFRSTIIIKCTQYPLYKGPPMLLFAFWPSLLLPDPKIIHKTLFKKHRLLAYCRYTKFLYKYHILLSNCALMKNCLGAVIRHFYVATAASKRCGQ